MSRVNAGTLELPYLDSKGGAGPGLWYRVTAVNAGGAWGPAFRALSCHGQDA